MNPYEALYIFKPDMEEETRKTLVERFSTIVTAGGGQVEKIDEWGKRRLAYPIQFLNEGYYVLMTFSAPGELVHELERNLQINENVIRYLVTRTDD
nr:30S ribosomal protein S6 [bacterium]